MRNKVISLIIIVLGLTLTTPLAHAQRGGFIAAGIRPPVQSPVQPFVNAPVQPFVTSPVAPFGMSPVMTRPVIPPFVGPTHLNPGLVTAGIQPPQTVFIGPRFVPNNTVVVPNTVVAPSTFVAPPPVTVITPGPVAPPVNGMPRFPAGTPRGRVIEQLGQPAVTIVTRDGELLGFSNGAQIFLQNGMVVIR